MSLKNLFYRSNDDKPVVQPKPEQTTTKPVVKPVTSNLGAATFGASAIIATEFDTHMDDVLKQKKLQGTNYYEFSQSLNKLANKPMTEEAKYLAVFSTLEMSGLTKEVLNDSSKKYQEILVQEKFDFKAAIEDEIKVSVDAKLKEANDLLLENENITKQIEELNAKGQANLNRVAELQNEAEENRKTLDTKYNNFVTAVDNAVTKIGNIITKVQTYIQ